jgi:uncharacterized protein (TIGR03118 family)
MRAALLAALVVVCISGAASVAATLRSGAHGYTVHPLVSDERPRAVNRDRSLVNSWGLAASPTGPWWTANEANDTSTLYSGAGRKQLLTVHVEGGPTGIVFHGGKGFPVRGGGATDPARFIYACEDGMIRAWTPTVPGPWSDEAEVVVDEAGEAAVFRGIAIAAGRVYATDFHNGRVAVYDNRWRRIRRAGAFADPAIPQWYAPFGIQAVGNRVFVSFVWRAPVNGNDAPTGGYVDEFDLDGRLVARVGHTRELDQPWGVALAPRGFGRFGGDLLVANFGSGAINAYARRNGRWSFDGRLPVKAPGVWGIAFGNGAAAGPHTTLFYAAGPHRWHGATEVDVHGELGSVALGN